jgi:hypothetical protein
LLYLKHEIGGILITGSKNQNEWARIPAVFIQAEANTIKTSQSRIETSVPLFPTVESSPNLAQCRFVQVFEDSIPTVITSARKKFGDTCRNWRHALRLPASRCTISVASRIMMTVLTSHRSRDIEDHLLISNNGRVAGEMNPHILSFTHTLLHSAE